MTKRSAGKQGPADQNLLAAMPYAKRAEDYARGAAEGTLNVCEPVRQAYRKWFRYRDRYDYRPLRLNLVCHLMEMLSLPEGKRGARFNLLPWQCALLSWPFAFFTEPGPEGIRAIEEMNLIIPRKAGKSSLAAGMMLVELVSPTGEGDESHEVLILGTNIQTADIAFSKIRKILRGDQRSGSHFIDRFEIRWTQNKIECGVNGGVVEKISSGAKSLEGRMAVMVFADEIARLEDEQPIEVLRSGLGHNPNSFLFTATTPSDLPQSAMEPAREQTVEWLKNPNDLGGIVGINYEAPLDAPIHDERVWHSVQPGLGHTVNLQFYRNQAQRATYTEKAEYNFETRQLCKFLSGGAIWVSQRDLEQLAACAWGLDAEGRDLVRVGPGWVHWIGVDMSDVKDTTSLCLLSINERTKEKEARWKIFFPTGERLEAEFEGDEDPVSVHAEKVHRRYAEAVKRGEVIPCAGRAINHVMVADQLIDWVEKYKPFGMVCDHYDSLTEVRKHLPDSYELMWYRQPKSAAAQSGPARTIESWVRHRQVKFEKNEVVMQHFRNTRVVQQPGGGILLQKPTKDSVYKIDAVDALLNAVSGHDHSLDADKLGTKMRPYDTSRHARAAPGGTMRRRRNWRVFALPFLWYNIVYGDGLHWAASSLGAVAGM